MSWTWLAALVPFFSAIVGAAVGGLVVHRTALARDARNEQRARRVEHLISAYQRLSAASNREGNLNPEQAADLEAALSEVMLLGQRTEIGAARAFMVTFATEGGAELDPLLIALRSSLSEELGLDPTPLPKPYSIRLLL